MMPLLVLDCHYLCHRAFHTSRELSFAGRPTGVVFGFLKSIGALKDEFQTDLVAFCFEDKKLYRRDIYPNYKRRRGQKQRTPEEQKAYEGLALQISELRQRYLPKIGFKNVFCFQGMESDDIMAAIAKSHKGEVILITSDSDLLQCLSDTVSMYCPHKQRHYTQGWFEKEYGIPPRKWALVKAIAGCSSDEVKGIHGVGEKTALRFLRGELSSSSDAVQKIMSPAGRLVVTTNRRLVELPYKDCPTPAIVEDQISTAGWKEVCQLLGMRTLITRPPVSTRRIVR